MKETMDSLNAYEIGHNGLFSDEYVPLIINDKEQKIAIFTCTDMMNIPFAENCNLKTLHIDDVKLNEAILSYKKKGFFIILYAHVGILFSRYVNPTIRILLQEKIDFGADIIITAHSHCVGGMEYYKGKPIFHSLGDFVMDGGSYRRRQSVILDIEVVESNFKSYTITPVVTNKELVSVLAPGNVQKKVLNSWNRVSMKIDQHSDNYQRFFKRQYKRELFQHTLSTIKFLFHTKGLLGMIKMISRRYEEVFRMGKWITKDRSKDRRDDEAILKDRKKFSEKELYKS
jgi:2',3'-cyclic-nucleotide 2'-phosphodiesterase (5'-nucleotidase family)